MVDSGLKIQEISNMTLCTCTSVLRVEQLCIHMLVRGTQVRTDKYMYT